MRRDFIEEFMSYTEGSPSPRIFRLWSGITAVAGALEQRVWIEAAGRQMFPNLYVLLVAPPGVGKSIAIYPVEELWRSVKDFHLAPNNVTKAALMDALSAAARNIIIKGNSADLLEYHTLLVAADEFGVLVPAYDVGFLTTMSRLWDVPESHSEQRRYGEQKLVDIIRPQITILSGVQPDMITTIMPEEAWGQGFAARFIMVYSDEKIRKTWDLATAQSNGSQRRRIGDKTDPAFRSLMDHMARFAVRFGQFIWNPACVTLMQKWEDEGLHPEPEHTRLAHYVQRRLSFIARLAMIASASRSDDNSIEMEDMERARDWLLEAEATMPSIFAAMGHSTDWKLMSELFFHIFSNGNNMPEWAALRFLSSRVASEKALKMLDLAERSNLLTRNAGSGTYSTNVKPER